MRLTTFYRRKNAFQTIKTRTKSSRKIRIFSKGFFHGFGQKFKNFPSFFSRQKNARLIRFTIFYTGKMHFQTIKTRTQTSRKTSIFSKGLVHGFGQKFENFPSFISRQNSQNNTFHHILEGKNVYLGHKNKKLKKSKNWNFSIFPFQAKEARIIRFTIFWKEKKSIQTIKTRS